MIKACAALILTGAALCGCAADPENQSATDYLAEAAQAQAHGHWNEAATAYAKGLPDAEIAWSDQDLANLHFKYGQVLGVICQFDYAEVELNTAVTLYQNIKQPTYSALAELGRVTLAEKNYADSTGYFERVLPELDRADIAHKQPAFYADVLDDYAIALAGAKRLPDSARYAVQAQDIRNGTPKSVSMKPRMPYGERCPKG